MKKVIELTIVTQRLRKRFDAWCDDNTGATAVEFALVATPFFFLIFGMLELAILFIVTTTLEFGLNEASRDIRTGAFQASGTPTLAAFRAAVCPNLFGLLDCSDLEFDVRSFSSFSGATPPAAINPSTGTINAGAFTFSPGTESQIVIASAYYEWDLITPVISRPLANLTTTSRLIGATIAFQNEPF